MYKKVIVSKTDLEITVEKVFSTIARKNISISIYTDEFDLYMFKLFFPASTSKLGYLKDSIAFADGKSMYPDILSDHAITIVRNPENILERYKDKSEKIETIGVFQVFYLKDSELKEYEEIKEDSKYIKNSIVKCDYVCTLFPPKDGVDTSKLEITNIGVYSITPYKYNLKIVKLIEEKVGKDITIVDATACVGGDTIGFAMNFKRVLSIEKDPINYTALYNNINVYKLNNVTTFGTSFVFNDDYDIVRIFKPDVIYFDPPWGGKDYHLHKKLDLFLDGKNIKHIVNDILEKYNFIKLIILKVPFNFNYDDIDKLGKVDIHNLKKFHVVMINN